MVITVIVMYMFTSIAITTVDIITNTITFLIVIMIVTIMAIVFANIIQPQLLNPGIVPRWRRAAALPGRAGPATWRSAPERHAEVVEHGEIDIYIYVIRCM